MPFNVLLQVFLTTNITLNKSMAGLAVSPQALNICECLQAARFTADYFYIVQFDCKKIAKYAFRFCINMKLQ
jgi:hypothetical protein